MGHRLAGGGGVDGDVAVIKHKYSYNSICRLKSQYTTLRVGVTVLEQQQHAQNRIQRQESELTSMSSTWLPSALANWEVREAMLSLSSFSS